VASIVTPGGVPLQASLWPTKAWKRSSMPASPAEVGGDGPDAVAHAEEREVGVDHQVDQREQVRLDALLQVGLLRVGDVEGTAPEDHPRVVGQVEGRQGPRLHPHVFELLLGEP
jgi:hypothetical protein